MINNRRIDVTIFLWIICLVLSNIFGAKQVNAKEANVANDVITATDSASKEILNQFGLFSPFSNTNILVFNSALECTTLKLKENEQVKSVEKGKEQEDKEVKQEEPKSWTHEFHVTAYCGCYSCSEGYGTQTSTGVTAEAGRTIAVDPDVVPYGSKVQINGHTYIAEDCGGAIDGYDIDIYMDEHSSTDRFGSQYIQCTVYTK